MEDSKKIRIKITKESVANIGVAEKAKIVPVKGGYNVEVSNKYGKEKLKNRSGEIVYRTKGAAKNTVLRHNKNIKWEEEKVLPSKSMRPPEDEK